MIKLLPEPKAQRWRTFVDEIYAKNQREGSQATHTEFMASLINVPDTPYPPDLNERISGDVDFFFGHEFKTFYKYQPNIESIRNHNVKRYQLYTNDRAVLLVAKEKRKGVIIS